MRVTQGLSVVAMAAVCVAIFICMALCARAQQPASPSPPDSQPGQQAQQPDSSSSAPSATPSAQPSQSSGSSSSSSSGKHTHANDFLVIGTVFTDNAYALPRAHIRVRRTGEKKFRWETYTNSRGEFALRVPQGGEYEIVVLAKGFADQTIPVSAKSGIGEDNVVYRMQPAPGGKK